MLDTSNYFGNHFTQLYEVSKTLCFALKPYGKTEYWIEKEGRIEEEKKREGKYKVIKQVIDDYHRVFLNDVLSNCEDIDWSTLEEAYKAYRNNKDQKTSGELKKIQKQYAKLIEKHFKDNPKYKVITGGKKTEVKMVECLPDFIEKSGLYSGSQKEEMNSAVEAFAKRTTQLRALHDNRMNLYAPELKASSVVNRIIVDNFPKFLNNIQQLAKATDRYGDEFASKLEKQLSKIIRSAGLEGFSKMTLRDFFSLDNYNLFLTQEGIDIYNLVIGGFKDETQKVQGINELLNEISQKNPEKGHRFTLTPLYKQLLFDDDKAWVNELEPFGSLNEAIKNVNEFNDVLLNSFEVLNKTFLYLKECEAKKVFLSAKGLPDFSNLLFEKTGELRKLITVCATENLGPCSKMTRKSEKEKWLKRNTYSLEDIYEVLQSIEEVSKVDLNNRLLSSLSKTENQIKELHANIKKDGEGNTEKTIEALKAYLDKVMSLYHFVKTFKVSTANEVDYFFCDKIDELLKEWMAFVPLYNRVRNFCTKKQYTKKKFQLFFDISDFLNGWAYTKLNDHGATLLKNKDRYYLAVLNRRTKTRFEKILFPSVDSEWEVMRYFQIPEANKYIPKSSLSLSAVKDFFADNPQANEYKLDTPQFTQPLLISKKVFDVYHTKQYTEQTLKQHIEEGMGQKEAYGLYLDSIETLKNFYITFLCSYKSTCEINFSNLKNRRYDNMDTLYKDIEREAYSLTWSGVSEESLEECNEQGIVLLWELYNKDFSSSSSGRKNLHTSYFLEAMQDTNKAKGPIQLNGGAEMFFRPKSIDSPTVHRKGELIVNKTYQDGATGKRVPISNDVYCVLSEYAQGNESVIQKDTAESRKAKELLEAGLVKIRELKHDIVKDKRFCSNQYELHLPITLNYGTSKIDALKNNSHMIEMFNSDPSINLIGIDRGERHLLYISVINQKGKLLFQKSLNEINGFDYWNKLNALEKKRKEQRKSWKSIEEIKNAKKGYLSTVVNELIKLSVEYNALLVLEDLSDPFKESRKKIEKSVYQEFEKQLINKLNYCSFKPEVVSSDENGGICKGFQLANPMKWLKNMRNQNGALIYIPASYTSHIDPTTGFTDYFFPRWNHWFSSVERMKDFFGCMNSIVYNKEKNWFEFSYCYASYGRSKCEYTNKEWIVCSTPTLRRVGKKIGGEIVDKEINVNDVIIQLMNDYSVDYQNTSNLKDVILDQNKKDFYIRLLEAFKNLIELRYSGPSSQDEKIDRIISPVENMEGFFYDSNEANQHRLPIDGDANGAFNIARKGLMYLKGSESKNSLLRLAKKNQNDWFDYCLSNPTCR